MKKGFKDKNYLKRIGTGILSVSIIMMMSLSVFAEEEPQLIMDEDNPAGVTIEETEPLHEMDVNYGTINTVNNSLLHLNSGEIGKVVNDSYVEENDKHIGYVDELSGVGYNSPNAKVDVMDGSFTINEGYIGKLNNKENDEYYNICGINDGFIKEKTDLSVGLRYNTCVIERDDGAECNNPFSPLYGAVEENFGLILKEDNATFNNYGVLNMGDGIGVAYNGVPNKITLKEAYRGYLEDRAWQGIIISDRDSYAVESGGNDGVYIFREGTDFIPKEILDLQDEYQVLCQDLTEKYITDFEFERQNNARIEKLNKYRNDEKYKDYFSDFQSFYSGSDIKGSTFIALDEKDIFSLETLVGRLNESISDPAEKNTIVTGAALYETNLGALGANWVGKTDIEGNEVTTLKNDEAKEYLEQICKAYGYNMTDFKIAGYVNIPVGTDISKYADDLGLFTQQSVYDGNFKLLTDDTLLEKGVTYHLYYVLVSEVITKEDEKKEAYIIIPSGDKPSHSGKSSSQSAQSAPAGETGCTLSDYTPTPIGVVPFVSGNTATAGWASITDAVLANANGTLDITMNGTATVDNKIMSTAAASNTSLSLSIDNDVKVDLTPATMNKIMSLPTVDEAGNLILDANGKPVAPFLCVSALTYPQGNASTAGTCGFSFEEMTAIGATQATPVVKVTTSNTDRSQTITIVFNAKEAGIELGKPVYLYGGYTGNMGCGASGIVGPDGLVTFTVQAVDGFWTIGSKKI